uniref:Uncharacterized protein n=1 Tax=Oryza meridionalis TaxID=40149 RepID=A0A0E0CL56_9ORYZ
MSRIVLPPLSESATHHGGGRRHRPVSGGRPRLTRRHHFGPRCRTLDNTLTSNKVFTWANSNNQQLLHVGDIDRTSK